MSTIAKPNQSMLDIIITSCGTLEGGMQLMTTNNTGITDVPVVGQSFIIPGDANTDAATLLYLQQNNTVIGTAGN